MVATLWPVEDESASRFAARFYDRLTGEGTAAALAHAQREMLADPGTAHPYYWAGYQDAGRDAGRIPQTVDARRSSVSVSR